MSVPTSANFFPERNGIRFMRRMVLIEQAVAVVLVCLLLPLLSVFGLALQEQPPHTTTTTPMGLLLLLIVRRGRLLLLLLDPASAFFGFSVASLRNSDIVEMSDFVA